MNSQERKVVALTCLAHGLTHVYMLIFPAVLPLMLQEFSGGIFRLSLVGNLAYFTYGLGALPAGIIADRVGSRRLIAVGLLGVALASLAIGLSPTLTALSLAMFLFGTFASFYHPSGLAWVSKGVRTQGRALGYHGMAGNVGLAFSPFIAGAIAASYGWRGAYLLFALPGIALGLVVLFSGRAHAPAEAEAHSNPSEAKLIGAMAIPPTLILVYAIATLGGFIYRGSLTFLPTYLTEKVTINVLGIEGTTLGGLITTIALLIGMMGQYAGGRLAERFRPEIVWALLMALLTPLLFLLGRLANAPLIAVTMGFILTYFCSQPVGNVLVARFTPSRSRGLGYGISFLFTFGVGSFATGFSGYIAERYGLNRIFYTLGGIALLALTIALILTWVSARAEGEHEGDGVA
ncbi:MAG TPA: MFS transporter [Anaerolineae bacterium]|nr:MFS transporter [Anaerolineae bacterium]